MAIVHIGVSKADQDEFIRAYGETLLEWNYVEHRLFMWFWHLTGLDDEVARAIFFSATKSFQARSDLLSGVVGTCKFDGEVGEAARAFIKEAIVKAKSYMGLRNSLAHGLAIVQATEDGGKHTIVQGKHPIHLHAETGITIESFYTASHNFEILAALISKAWYHYQGKHLPTLQECSEQLSRLPSAPESETLSQNQVGRLRQQQLAKGKKPGK
jgi:hypothetical protein